MEYFRLRKSELYDHKIISFKEKNFKHFIIFGNDSTINNVKPERVDLLRQEGFIICGVNRIYHAFDVDILYFEDFEIIDEIENNNYQNKIANTKLYCSERTVRRAKGRYGEENVKVLLEKYDIIFLSFRKIGRCPFSVKNLMISIKEKIYKDKKCTFYLFGTGFNLKLGHFWKDKKLDIKTVEKLPTNDHYKKRFNIFIRDIKLLKKNEKYAMFSLMEKTTLNDFLSRVKINLT